MVHSLGVVVNQRDRYDWPEALIAALFQNLPAGTPVLFVDGGSPPAVRDVLQRSAEQWGFALLRREAFTSANQARLLALERLSVSYLLCVENDVRLAPGCAEALVAAAERHWADVVVPLVLEENDRGRQRIHLAGGTCRLRRTWGGCGCVFVNINAIGPPVNNLQSLLLPNWRNTTPCCCEPPSLALIPCTTPLSRACLKFSIFHLLCSVLVDGAGWNQRLWRCSSPQRGCWMPTGRCLSTAGRIGFSAGELRTFGASGVLGPGAGCSAVSSPGSWPIAA